MRKQYEEYIRYSQKDRADWDVLLLRNRGWVAYVEPEEGEWVVYKSLHKPDAPKARKPKKAAAAKPRKTTKKAAKPNAKKTAATPKLTASQREYLAIQGFVMVKRGGKYVKITR